MTPKPSYVTLFSNIHSLITEAQSHLVRNVNKALVFTNFEIGRMIIENEQKGKRKATYAASTLKNLSKRLTKEFGSGYSVDNLELMRKFYQTYSSSPPISETASRKLKNGYSPLAAKDTAIFSWSHYVQFLKIQDTAERRFYEIETHRNRWTVKELNRQYNTSLYERLALSKSKKAAKVLSKKGQVIQKPTDALKDHLVLEFLDLQGLTNFSESDLETAIISKLEHFMLELGKGFLFEGRQRRISIGTDHFFVDLVFYNRLLHCFVLFDLKIGKLTHQDIGQMQMYVNYYDRFVKMPDEQPTIGIILCKEENKAVVEITLPENNRQIFAKEYKLYLPSKEELQKQLL